MKYLKQLTASAACLAFAGALTANAAALPCAAQKAATAAPSSSCTQSVPSSVQQALQKLGISTAPVSQDTSTANCTSNKTSCASKTAVNAANTAVTNNASCAAKNKTCATKKVCASKSAACAANKAACAANKAACKAKTTCSSVKAPVTTPAPTKVTTPTTPAPVKVTTPTTTTPAPVKVTTPVTTPAPTPTKTTTPTAGSTSNSSYVAQVVELVNKERTSRGLQPVTVDTKLQAAAQVRATEIVQSFSHTRPNGSSPFTALAEKGVSYRGAGENIAYGQRTPQEVMTAWMNSSGHRANILNAQFTTIGVGYAVVNGQSYWSQEFTY